MRLRPAPWHHLFLLAVSSSLLIGCENATFLPPPDLPSPSPNAAAEPSSRTIDLILDHSDLADHDLLERQLRVRASFDKAILDVGSLEPGDPPARQAELIRAALARKTAALVIRPVDAPEVTAALKDAQTQGVPIVLLDRAVAGLSEASPVTLVTYAPFAESAAQLVAAVKAAAARDKLRADGVAILMVNTDADSRSGERVEALRKAIEGGGLTLSDTLKFQDTPQNAQPVLVGKLDADPRVTMVFADEDRGVASVHHTSRRLIGKRRFTVAGYLNFNKKNSALIRTETTAVADRNEPEFATQAMDAAVRLSRGERTPPKIELAHPVDLGTRAPTPIVD